MWNYRGILIITTLLSACTVGPDYSPPAPNLHTQRWAAVPEKATQGLRFRCADTKWWQSFHDPLLNQYIDLATNHNLDIGISQQRLLQARALRNAVHAEGGPQIDGTGSVTSEHISQYGRILGLFPNNPIFQNIPLTRKVYEPGFDASWELDIFGQRTRKNQRSSADEQAAIADVGDTVRQIRAELARNYFDLRANQQRTAILQRNIALQEKTLALTRQRLKAGSDNQLSVELSKSQLQNSKAQLPSLQARSWALAAQIALLLGQEPMDVWPELSKVKPLPTVPSKIAVGLPSDLLRRRPDIAKAERMIAAATAEIGVAVADLYPKFNLTADVALESLYLNTLWRSKSSIWTIGPFMQWALFHSGQIHANIHRREAEQGEAVLQYQKTVLNALREAETALDGFQRAQQSSSAFSKAVKANQRTVRLSNQRYTEGEDNILTLIQVQQDLLTVETSEIDAKQNTLVQLVSLYKAVGGEWDIG